MRTTCNNPLGMTPALKNSLDIQKDFAARGLITREYASTDGFNLSKYEEMHNDNKTRPLKVHENLWEQAKLNMNYGLYRVNRLDAPIEYGELQPVKIGDIFQIRGNDLANMTIVFDGTGWIVLDVLSTKEVANKVWIEIVQSCFDSKADVKFGTYKKITAIVYSHSHVDHYGGVEGLAEFFASNVKIIAPEGFLEHAVSENIHAGAIMQRRASYQYGTNLESGSVTGHVDCGLGTKLSIGTSGIIAPTDIVSFNKYDKGEKFQTIMVGKVPLSCQYTPGTEAPAEMNVFLFDQNVLFIAENCAGTLHNLLTPRGAQVRDPLAWAKFLDETLLIFGSKGISTICAAHNWPQFGKLECRKYIENQRDVYTFINNATLHYANQGFTIDEVGRMVEESVPPVLSDYWNCRGFYGTFNHNAKAVYQKYIGWYDGNPSHLNRLMPAERASRYIEAIGAKNLIDIANKAAESNCNDELAWAVELYDYIFNANADEVPNLTKIRKNAIDNYANALNKLGYASEAATWRNMYLTAAMEILALKKSANSNEPQEIPYMVFTEETINAMSLEMILQYLGIMLNHTAVENNGISEVTRWHITVTSEEKKEGEKVDITEYAVTSIQKGILYYRILGSEDEFKSHMHPQLKISGSKVDFFRAFIEHDKDKFKSVIKTGTVEDAIDMVLKNFVRFSLNIPIMTARKLPY